MIIVILLPACFLKWPIDLFNISLTFLPIVTVRFVIVLINEHDDDDDDDDVKPYALFLMCSRGEKY